MTKIHEPAEKKLEDMSAQEKRLFAAALSWQGKPLPDCTKTELIACIMHMTSQVVLLKNKLDATTTPFYKRPYWINRFYWRGNTWLGVVNTALAFISNRVVVKVYNNGLDGVKFKGYEMRKAADYPRSK